MKQFFFWRRNNSLRQSAIFILLFLIAFIGISCKAQLSNNPPQENIKSSTQPTATNTLRVAVVPWQSPEVQQKKLQPLADYIQQTTGRSVTFQITKSYESAVDLLAKEEVEIAYLAALTYVQARERNTNLEPIVVPIDKTTGRPWYSSVVVVKSSSGIKSLQDLKGKRFAFVSPSSTSGFLMPMAEFKAKGIEPERDFKEVEYPGSHDKTETALAAGEVDAIADDKSSFLRSQKSGKLSPSAYKVIWESSPIPTGPIVINTKKFPPELVAKLKQALIDAPVGVVDVSGTESAGYTLAKDADFEQIRQIYSSLKSLVAQPK